MWGTRGQIRRAQAGFTLVELLVVTILIALLAAIAIPSLFAQRDKARDADAKETARVAALAMETWRTDRGGDYDGATAPGLASIEPILTGAPLSVVAASGRAYELAVASASGNVFTIARQGSGTQSLTCVAPGTAGCPAGGRWD
jgi:prepilin-type N-terminal cleavage/methylation domain-containing protein